MAPEETTTTSRLSRLSSATSAASVASQSRLTVPAVESTINAEPTLTTMRFDDFRGSLTSTAVRTHSQFALYLSRHPVPLELGCARLFYPRFFHCAGERGEHVVQPVAAHARHDEHLASRRFLERTPLAVER